MRQKEKEYEKLKLRVLKIGIAIPGTIRETFLICGKENCKCAQSEHDRHGPYYFWNRKVGGKLTSKSLNSEQRHQYEQWISNRRQLEELVEAIVAFSLNYATLLQHDAVPGKSRKTIRAKRGK